MGAHYTFTEEERTPTSPWPTPATEKDAGPRRWEAAAAVLPVGGGGFACSDGRRRRGWRRPVAAGEERVSAAIGSGRCGDERALGNFERGSGLGSRSGQVKGCDNPKRSAPSRMAPNCSIWVQLAQGVRRHSHWRRPCHVGF